MRNKRLRSLINKYTHQAGAIHAFELKTELLARAAQLERSGMPLLAIIKTLGIPMPQPDKLNASEELK